MTTRSANRIEILDSLRGLAALAVCYFHFAARDGFLPDGLVKECARPGYLGVVVFFVVSGFVIPWVLHRADYRLAYFGRFLSKRLIRLEPPYLVAVASCVGFAFVYSSVKSLPFPPDTAYWTRAALHLGYLVRFFDREWFMDVFWTLAIEFQFYLLMGLAFPLLGHRRAGVRWASSAALAGAALLGPLLPEKTYLPGYLPLFLCGLGVFYYRAGLVGRRLFPAVLLGLGALCYSCGGWSCVVASLGTACLIAWVDVGHPLLNRLGAISYSLYLFHALLGGAVINLGVKLTDSAGGRYAVLAAAFGTALVVALGAHRFVERPSQVFSSRIAYRPPNAVPLPEVEVGPVP